MISSNIFSILLQNTVWSCLSSCTCQKPKWIYAICDLCIFTCNCHVFRVKNVTFLSLYLFKLCDVPCVSVHTVNFLRLFQKQLACFRHNVVQQYTLCFPLLSFSLHPGFVCVIIVDREVHKDKTHDKAWLCFGNTFIKMPNASAKHLLEKGWNLLYTFNIFCRSVDKLLVRTTLPKNVDDNELKHSVMFFVIHTFFCIFF